MRYEVVGEKKCDPGYSVIGVAGVDKEDIYLKAATSRKTGSRDVKVATKVSAKPKN
jgi:hypothetical protein